MAERTFQPCFSVRCSSLNRLGLPRDHRPVKARSEALPERLKCVLSSLAMDPNIIEQMMRMMTGGVVAQSISVAAELGIADQLASGEKSSPQLAVLLNADEQKVHRLMRFLASIGIFQVNTDGAWQMTPLAGCLLNDVPYSVRAGARMLGRMSVTYPHMIDNVRTGTCAYNLAFGKPIFEDLSGKPEDAAIFDAAMNSFHGGETDAVFDAYSYEGVGCWPTLGAAPVQSLWRR